MLLNKPLIGITSGYDYEEQKIYLNDSYTQAIYEAGGIGVLLPVISGKEVIDRLAETFDGFLLSGGPDVDPKHYNEYNMPCNGAISPLRDEVELDLIRKAFEKKKPIFGVCRGVQVLNVAMGGTLYQDINTQVKNEKIQKHSQQAPKWYATHNILITKNSRMWDCFKCDYVKVNSFHHQAIKDVALGFKVTSKSSDGIIESIEYEGNMFAVGTQWHPEIMWQKDIIHLRIFEKFIEAARKEK